MKIHKKFKILNIISKQHFLAETAHNNYTTIFLSGFFFKFFLSVFSLIYISELVKVRKKNGVMAENFNSDRTGKRFFFSKSAILRILERYLANSKTLFCEFFANSDLEL